MRTWMIGFLALTFCTVAECQTLKSTLYVDFGPNDVTNGNSTVGADANGNNWNSVANTAASAIGLVNHSGSSSGFNLSVAGSFLSNGKLNGGLLSPSASLLGEYAIASATQDYFYTATSGSIKISGLTPGNGFVFHLFGSRETSETRVTQFTLSGVNSSTVNLTTSGSGVGANSYNGNNNKIAVSDTIAPDANGEITLTVLRSSGTYAHLNLMKVQEFVSPSKYPSTANLPNPLKIAYFGSSVPYGQGASTLNKGYTALYSSLLAQRKIDLGTKNWETVNISVPGDNTVKVLARYNSDFVPQKAKYVVYALALGNEGIHESGQPAYDQFKSNIQQLIKQAKDAGYVPVVTNSYTRNDYNSTDYNYIRQMNLFLAQLDVPSINLLGAVDDGSGHWVNSYWTDALHPNDNGHAELSYTMVPSLFDALDKNKAIPQKLTSTYVTLVKRANENRGKSLEFKPENTVHAFTQTFSIKTSNKGTIAEIKEASGAGYLSINNSGQLQYISPKTGTITGTIQVNDNAWHTISLTHYYARGETILYADNTAQGSLSEKLVISQINIGALGNTGSLLVKDWFFHRSGMNADEINALSNGTLLKSSLELYAPLDGKTTVTADSLINLAQSTNTISAAQAVLPLNLKSFSAKPENDAIRLDWQTANEVNVLGFVVERKQESSEFSAISPLLHGGSSLYSYIDKDITTSNPVYYRLKLIDRDGSYTYSTIIISKITGFETAEFSVFPNPFTDDLTVCINNSKKGTITLGDLNGNSLRKVNTNSVRNTLNLQDLNRGTYILNIQGEFPSFKTLIIKN